MRVNFKYLRKIELLKIISKDCKKYLAYRAIRKATGRCKECVVIWNTRLELNKIENS